MRIQSAVLGIALLASLTACTGGTKSDIGLIDADRIANNWPRFLNARNQLAADQQAIASSKGSNAEKARAVQQLQQRFVQTQSEITNEVSDAAKQVAQQKGLKYVFTRQFVGYGGVDITPDVEKILKITETTESPKP